MNNLNNLNYLRYNKIPNINISYLYKIYPHLNTKYIIQYENYNKFKIYKIIDKIIKYKNKINNEHITSYLQNIIDLHYLLKLHLYDPNYYFDIFYNFLINFLQIDGFKNNNNKLQRKLKNLIYNFHKFIDIIKDNIIYTKRDYIEKLKYNLIFLNDLNINKDYIKIISYNFNILINHYETKKLFIDYNFTIDNLNILFSNKEMFDINLNIIYNYALKDYKKCKVQLIKIINEIDKSSNNYINKIEKYIYSHQTDNDITKYALKLFSNVNNFLTKYGLNKKYINYKLNIKKNKNYHWIINNYNNNIILYLPNSTYHKYLNMNSLIHEYMHYIQYSSDIIKKNELSLSYYSTITGEGVAYYFEQWFLENNYSNNKHYLFSYYYDNILRITRFILAYEYHSGFFNLDILIKKFKKMSILFDEQLLVYEYYRIINNYESMEYYIGKYLILEYMKINKEFNPISLLINGSLSLKTYLI